MSTLLQGDQLRTIALGSGPVSKASGTLTDATTLNCFTVTGGDVLITHLWLKVTTTMAGANTLAVQANPTTGDTFVVVTATDLGTTDTTAGSIVGLTRGTTAASAFLRGGTSELNAVATTGTIELVETGTGTIDGAVTVNVMWLPLTAGALLVAS